MIFVSAREFMCCDIILFMWCMAGDWSRYVYIHVWWKLSFTKQNQSQKNIFFSNMSIVRETAVFLFFSWYCLLLYSIVWDLICLPISVLALFARFIMCLEKKKKKTSLQLGQISVSLRSGQNCGCCFFFYLTPILQHSGNSHICSFSPGHSEKSSLTRFFKHMTT